MKSFISVSVASLCAIIGASAAHAQDEPSGHLGILNAQAPTITNPYLTASSKDLLAASPVLEPLARLDEEGHLVPTLVTEAPTIENGGISADYKTVLWKIKPGLVWSDGSAFTAEDVVFTADYCQNKEMACQSLNYFANVDKVEAVDDLTVKVSYVVANPVLSGPFIGHRSPVLQKAQFQECVGARATQCTEQNFNPIGTGPFVVKEFKPGDLVSYEANPLYRDPGKPGFKTLQLKGGGDAVSAARAVLETGEYDYAFNLQVEPEVLAQMEAIGRGVVMSSFGGWTENMPLNQTDPSVGKGDIRSTPMAGPHPIFRDRTVTRALSLAIDRSILAEIGYGSAARATCNILPKLPGVDASTNVDWCLTSDVEEANRLLDEAGWVRGADGVRVKDGTRLSLLFQTSTSSVRQGNQTLIKDMWSQIGVETELRNIDPAVHFSQDPSSPDTYYKFYADVQMYSAATDGIDAQNYLSSWRCSSIPQPDNNWLGLNIPRHCSAVFDELSDQLRASVNPVERAEIARKLNDLIIESGAVLALFNRDNVSARSARLEGVRMNSWDSELWNIADWRRTD